MKNSSEMEFTGERYVPSVDGQIKYEHLHRYALCFELVSDKSVLDLASGEGYGSALLAKVAQSVIGVDIDTESVEYAKHHYIGNPNLKFLVGSCESVPLPDESIDVITSFETIEHHDKHEEMIQEIKRILKPDGTLIISSPNRFSYSDEQNYSNHFHVKELYYDELVSLLSQHFKYVKIYGQSLVTGSFVLPLQNSDQNSIKAYTGSASNLSQQVSSLKSPVYFVAVCSNKADNIQSTMDSVYIDSSDDLLKALQNSRRQTEEALSFSQAQLKQTQDQLQQTHAEWSQSHSQMQQRQAELECLQSHLQQTLQETQTEWERIASQLQESQQQIQAELERVEDQRQYTQAELERSQAKRQHIQAELERAQAQLQQNHTEAERLQVVVKEVESSILWKLHKGLYRIKRAVVANSLKTIVSYRFQPNGK